jgi:hypothetical protein
LLSERATSLTFSEGYARDTAERYVTNTKGGLAEKRARVGVNCATREANLVAEGAHHKADARVAIRDAEVEARILRHKVELLEGELAKEQGRVTWLKGQRDQLLQGEKEYVKELAEQKLRTEAALRDLGHVQQERDYLREEHAAAAGKLKVIREERDSALTRREGLQKRLHATDKSAEAARAVPLPSPNNSEHAEGELEVVGVAARRALRREQGRLLTPQRTPRNNVAHTRATSHRSEGFTDTFSSVATADIGADRQPSHTRHGVQPPSGDADSVVSCVLVVDAL